MESRKFIMTSAFAVFSVLLALLSLFALQGMLSTAAFGCGVVFSLLTITGYPHVPGKYADKVPAFVGMGLCSFVAAAAFGFLVFSFVHALFYLLFAFVLYLVSFALRGN